MKKVAATFSGIIRDLSLSIVVYVSFVLLAAGCQMAPTRVSETQAREFEAVIDKSSRPIVLSEGTVVLDARTAFDYGLNRVRDAVHFSWADLAEKEESGELMRDNIRAVRKLALSGLEPAKPVVIVGYGQRPW